MNAEEKFKLNAGQIIIYPSSYLHAVSEVNSGNRLVCVGWIESYVKSTEKREYLFDLDAGARSLLAKHGRSDELDLIFKSYSNLLRLLGDWIRIILYNKKNISLELINILEIIFIECPKKVQLQFL